MWEKTMFGILLHAFLKKENFQQVLWMIQLVSDDDIKSYDEKIKTIPTNFNKKKVTCQAQSFNISLAIFLVTRAF